jgi:transposase InsO family protein
VPILADQGLYNSSGEDIVYGSERSFYRVLHAHGQAHRRGRARPPEEPREVPQLEARGPNQMRATTLESRLEELGVLRSFSRPSVSNDNPFSESLFRTVKYRPNHPRRLFQSVEKAGSWVAAFVEWTNNQHRHSGEATQGG